ncbi:protein of unknown function [Caballeronia sp. S22]
MVAASHGSEALRVAALQTPDLVVSDCQMPVLDGASLYRRFQVDPRLKVVPFIFMSGNVDARDIPIAEFLREPFDPAIMIQAIAGLLNRERRLGK